MDRFGRYLRFCDLEFDKEAILTIARVKTPVSVDGILSDITVLSFWGHCGPRFFKEEVK